jgi:hypothetical protein
MKMAEFHHAYIGAAALVLAWVLLFTTSTPDWLLALLMSFGIWMVVDDMYQHWRQKQLQKHYTGKEIPGWILYHSPVHRLYVYLFGGLHRKIERWLRK